MVVKAIQRALPGIPGITPGKAHPEHRAQRKQYEKENPHFNMQEFGLKAGVLVAMGTLALYPWEKKYDEHVRKEHPERLERRDRRGSVDEHRRGGGERRGEGERRRRSTDGHRRREDDYLRERRRDRDDNRRRSVAEGYDVRRSERRVEERSPNPLRLAVAEGYEYVPAKRDYIDSLSRRSGEPVEMRMYEDDVSFRPRRVVEEERRRR